MGELIDLETKRKQQGLQARRVLAKAVCLLAASRRGASSFFAIQRAGFLASRAVLYGDHDGRE